MIRHVPYDERLAVRVRDELAARDDVSERRMFGGLTFMAAGPRVTPFTTTPMLIEEYLRGLGYLE